MLNLPKGKEIASVESVLDNGHYYDSIDVVSTVKGLLQTLKFTNEQKYEIVNLTAKRLELLFDERNITYTTPVCVANFEFDDSDSKRKISLEAEGTNVTQIEYLFPKKQA